MNEPEDSSLLSRRMQNITLSTNKNTLLERLLGERLGLRGGGVVQSCSSCSGPQESGELPPQEVESKDRLEVWEVLEYSKSKNLYDVVVHGKDGHQRIQNLTQINFQEHLVSAETRIQLATTNYLHRKQLIRVDSFLQKYLRRGLHFLERAESGARPE